MAMPKEQIDAFLATIPTMPAEKLLKLFLRTREASAAATRDYEEDKAQFRAIMDACENMMLAAADKQGVTGFKTDLGTTFTAETVKIGIADHGAFTGWLDSLPPDADKFGFFEQRVSSRRIEEYMKANGGAAPPGLNIFRERVMRVRKATEK